MRFGVYLSRGKVYTCKFGMEVVDAILDVDGDTVLCYSPTSIQSGDVLLEVAINSQNYTSSGMHFAYYVDNTVTVVSPSLGILFGGTEVSIEGSGFEDVFELQCKFGISLLASQYNITGEQWIGFALSNASHVADDHIKCIAPASVHAGAARSISYNFNTAPTHAHLLGSASLDFTTHVHLRLGAGGG